MAWARCSLSCRFQLRVADVVGVALDADVHAARDLQLGHQLVVEDGHRLGVQLAGAGVGS